MEISFSSIKNSFTYFFGRFHFIIFFIVGAGALGTAVLLLSNTIASSDTASGYTSAVNSIGFDQENKDTITRLKALKEPGEETEKLPLSGRISPF